MIRRFLLSCFPDYNFSECHGLLDSGVVPHALRVRTAFKEWAIVVDALGRGEQIIILRKGGIAEGPGGFRMDHERFLLFPTRFHQQRDQVITSAQARFDELAPTLPGPETMRIEFSAEVVAWRKVTSLADAEHLRGQHIWRDEVIAERFDWDREQAIFALALRVRRLSFPVELQMLPAYGGCKSWVELAEDLPDEPAAPVLSDSAFAQKLAAFHSALGGAA
jgi:hypothetical protein